MMMTDKIIEEEDKQIKRIAKRIIASD